jgi:hypothetical protein
LKKTTGILCLLIYISALSGWSAVIHYCGDKVASISILTSQENDDCCCNTVKSHCCSDQKVETKIHKDHRSQPPASSTFKPGNKHIPAPSAGRADFLSAGMQVSNSKVSHNPPLLCEPPVYLRNMVLII